MKRKIFSVLFALVLACSLGLVTAVPASAAGTPTIDGTVSSGEWDGAVSIPVASGMGTVKLLASTDYMHVLFDLVDSTDARLGENIHGNDQTSININPTPGPTNWGIPCDIIFQTGADPNAWGGTSSGTTDGWETDWEIDGTQLLSLPGDLETMTIYSGGTRISEWKVPLASIGVSPGDMLHVGGAIDVGDGSSYSYPPELNSNPPASWGDLLSYVEYSYIVENQNTGLYYQTIQDAIDAANSADTINVEAGTYVEAVLILGKPLTLQGEPGAIIKPDENTPKYDCYQGREIDSDRRAGIYIYQVDGVIIDGFEIDGTGTDVHYGIIGKYSDGSIVRNCVVHDIVNEIGPPVSDIGGVGIMFYNEAKAGWPGGAHEILIEDNVVYKTGRMGIFLGGWTDGWLLSSNNVIKDNNEVYDTWQGPTEGFGGAVTILGASNSLIQGNSIYNNTGLDQSGISILGWDSDPNSISENDIYNNYVGIKVSGGVVEVHYNNIMGNTYGVKNMGVDMVAAENNWWGKVNGPTHAGNTFNVGEQGNAVSDGVNFVPWLNAAYDIGVSFAPVENTDTGEQFSSIQAAIDDADTDANDIITVAAGEYNEAVLIDESLTLQGKDRETTIIEGIPTDPHLVGLLDILADGVNVSGLTIHSEIGTEWTIAAEGDNAKLTDLHVIHDNPAGAAIHIGRPYIGNIPINGFTFTESTVDSAKSGVFVPSDKGGSDFVVQKVEFATSWTAVELKGIDGAMVTECSFSTATYPVYISDSDGVEISGNKFVGLIGADRAIFLEAYPIGTTVGDVDILRNDISGSTTGIFLGEGLVTTGISIHYNNIEGNALLGINNEGTGMLDAKYNWWGSPTGPGRKLPHGKWVGKGDRVSDNVDYIPWLHKLKKDVVPTKKPSYAQPVVLDNTGEYGWNTFSTPIFLDDETDTWKELYDLTDLEYSVAYRFDSDIQEFVPLTIDDEYAIKPGEGFFIKMDDVGSLPILYSTEEKLIPPSRPLTEGWNLIGLASLEDMNVEDALASLATVSGLAGYSQVVSPTGNSEPGPVLADGTIYVGESYWVYMLGARTLAGFTMTPVDWMP